MAAFCPICFEGDGDTTSDFDALSSDEEADDNKLLGSGGDAQPPPVSAALPNDSLSSTTGASDAEPPHPKKFLIRGKYCSHGFCKSCLEAVLMVSPGSGAESGTHHQRISRQQQQGLIQGDDPAASSASSSSAHARHSGDVPIVGVPTQGSCPICRARLSLFDLRWLVNDSGSLENKSDDDKSSSSSSSNDDASNYVYKDEIVTDWTQTPLAGKVYANPQGVGRYSFHFDGADPRSSSSPPVGPYVNIEAVNRMTGNPNRAPDTLPLRNIQWHGPSRTMRAIMADPSSCLTDEMELIKCFSPGLRHVRAGATISYWATFSCADELHRAFPLDGTFSTSIITENGEAPSSSGRELGTQTVRVVADTFVVDRHQYMVRAAPQNNLVYFLCPDDMDLSRRGPWDFSVHPGGPRDGDFILCPVAPGMYEKWTMIRKATGPPPADVTYSGPSAEPVGQYRLLDAHPPLPFVPPGYHGATLHGNAFCQGGTAGLASYHFSAPDPSESSGDSTSSSTAHGISAYISYESPDVARWPPLDDGSRPPARVSFRDASFDPTTRTFTGSIRWLDEHGTTWQHMKRWDYVMRFDSEFTCIVVGNVTSYGVDDDDNDEGREFSRFGENLVYVNAALSEYFRASSLGTEEEASDVVAAPAPNSLAPPSSESFVRRSEAFRERLRQEGASVRTIAAVHREWVKACQASSLDPAGRAFGRAS
jgi:hypothetical protein